MSPAPAASFTDMICAGSAADVLPVYRKVVLSREQQREIDVLRRAVSEAARLFRTRRHPWNSHRLAEVRHLLGLPRQRQFALVEQRVAL